MEIQSMINRYLKQGRLLGILSTGMLLSACQPAPSVESNLTFNPPKTITQVRAVDQSKLKPVVKLSNGIAIPMRPIADNNWTGTINVQPNSTYFVSIEWIETLPEGDLVLALWARDVAVGDNGTQINLSDANYDFSIDQDGDQITNLEERQNNTNPFIPNDQSTGTTDANTDTGLPDTDVAGTAGDSDGEGATDSGANTDDGTSAGTDGNTDGELSSETSGNSDSEGSTDTGGNPDDGTSTSGSNEVLLTHIKASALIPRISTNQAPFIDGLGVNLNGQDELTGEWRNAVQFDDAGAGLWINNLMLNPDGEADGADGAELRRWAAMHDGINLYILVLSDDINARHADSTLPWQDDSVEIFIDGDNSKLTDWTSGDDFHVVIPLLKFRSTQANNEINGRFTPQTDSTAAASAMEFSTGPSVGPNGIRVARWEQDVYEIAIPLSSVGIVVGSPFGFEVQINDDDDGGNRDSKWGWYHPSRTGGVDTDRTYLDPSVMGVVVLEE